MNNYLGYLFAYDLSMFIYTIVFISSTILAFISQPSIYYGTKKIKKFPFILSLLFLWLIYAFNDVGTDIPNYRNAFHVYKTWNDCESSPFEFGYLYLNVLIHYFTDDSFIAIAIIKTLILYVAIWAIYRMRDKVVLGFCMLAYISICYFVGFSALRNSLAISISLLAFTYLLDNKYILSIILSVIAFYMHRSAIFFILSVILYIVFFVWFSRLKYIYLLTVFVGIVVVLCGYNLIEGYVLSNDVLTNKYDDYLVKNDNKMGLLPFILYFPLIIPFYCSYSFYKNHNITFWNINFIWIVIGFSIAILSYQMGSLTRTIGYFACPFLFFLPNYMLNNKKQFIYKKTYPSFYLSNKSMSILLWIYFVYRFSLLISGLYINNGLFDFKFIRIL